MVFFTCNACGASLKKNQVEKHYLHQCRQCEVLSCIDCQQVNHCYTYFQIKDNLKNFHLPPNIVGFSR